jgi:penicillin-binding protein 1A
MLTGRQIGPTETARIAKRCGLGGPFLGTEDLFRGSAAATPMEAATALATLANRGQRPKTHFITRITDTTGTVLYRFDPENSQAIGSHAAGEALDLLEPIGSSRCLSGHTGSERDAWLLRVGPTGSTAVWIGFDEPAVIAPPSDLQRLLDLLAKRLGR